MSITAQAGFEVRPWAGFPPATGLPSGQWISTVNVTGNASGGNRFLDIVFNRLDVPLSAIFYSLEQMAIFDGDNNAKEMDLESIGMDDAFDIGPSIQTNLNMIAGRNEASLDAQSSMAVKGIFLGRPRRAGAVSALTVTCINVNVANFQVIAQGYFWVPATANVEGGPRRPGGGIFR